MQRPETTLFMLMSVDGKISTGDTDVLDFDHDLPNIAGVREGLHQYYDLERKTDAFSLNTGRVMKKIGMNEKNDEPVPTPVSFVIIDNAPHLTTTGVNYLAKKLTQFILVTSNAQHPAFNVSHKNLSVIFEPKGVVFGELFERLARDFEVDALTIQSGGTLNAALLREGLIDYLSIVVAPLVVGGATTPTLADGEANHTIEDLRRLVALKLIEVTPLKDSYIHLRYAVLRHPVLQR